MDAQKIKNIIDVVIKILTVISGFLVGMGSATACTLMNII